MSTYLVYSESIDQIAELVFIYLYKMDLEEMEQIVH